MKILLLINHFENDQLSSFTLMSLLIHCMVIYGQLTITPMGLGQTVATNLNAQNCMSLYTAALQFPLWNSRGPNLVQHINTPVCKVRGMAHENMLS